MTSIFLHSACLLPRHSCPSDGSHLFSLPSCPVVRCPLALHLLPHQFLVARHPSAPAPAWLNAIIHCRHLTLMLTVPTHRHHPLDLIMCLRPPICPHRLTTALSSSVVAANALHRHHQMPLITANGVAQPPPPPPPSSPVPYPSHLCLACSLFLIVVSMCWDGHGGDVSQISVL